MAPLPSKLNVQTLTSYNVKKFFTQFGATPSGVWSNPIGGCPACLSQLENISKQDCGADAHRLEHVQVQTVLCVPQCTGGYVTERDGMELRNSYMYGLTVLFHR